MMRRETIRWSESLAGGAVPMTFRSHKSRSGQMLHSCEGTGGKCTWIPSPSGVQVAGWVAVGQT